MVFVSNGEGVSIRTQQSAPTDPNSLYDGESVDPGSDGAVSERQQLGTGPIDDASETEANDSTDDAPAGELAIETIHADAEGNDRENLNDEYVVFENVGDEVLSLGGWTVTDEAGKKYKFPTEFTLEAGETVTLRTGSGTDTETDLYWDAGSPVWNNGGDTVIITTADGERVLKVAYS